MEHEQHNEPDRFARDLVELLDQAARIKRYVSTTQFSSNTFEVLMQLDRRTVGDVHHEWEGVLLRVSPSEMYPDIAFVNVSGNDRAQVVRRALQFVLTMCPPSPVVTAATINVTTGDVTVQA